MSGMTPNGDFLSDKGEHSTPERRKRRTAKEIEQDNFPEYYALTEYHRKCLVATNYWRVILGLHEIPVPPSDTHYTKYFDKRCYERRTEMLELKKKQEQNEKAETLIEKAKEKIEVVEKVNEVLVKTEKHEIYPNEAVKQINEITGDGNVYKVLQEFTEQKDEKDKKDKKPEVKQVKNKPSDKKDEQTSLF